MNESQTSENTSADTSDEKTITPMKSIRQKCLDCCCGSSNEVKLCPITKCPLYEFRLGKNPNIKRTYTDEQREAMAKRLRNSRNK